MCSMKQLYSIPSAMCDAIADAALESALPRNDASEPDEGNPTQATEPHVCEAM